MHKGIHGRDGARWMKTRVVILLIGVAVVIATAGRVAVRSSVSRLEKVEEQVIQRYGANGVLADTGKRDAALNKVEEFIVENRGSLLVSDYERTPSSIIVTFLFGFHHVFQPRVEGLG